MDNGFEYLLNNLSNSQKDLRKHIEDMPLDDCPCVLKEAMLGMVDRISMLELYIVSLTSKLSREED